MLENKSINLIPTKNELVANYWFISPGTLSLPSYKKCLVEISTVSYETDELEFIFYISISNLIKQLELFSFDFTPIMVRIIKQHLTFLKTFCLKQKYANFFLSSTYIDQLSKVFQSLIELKRWRFVEQQICIDEIERICDFFKSRLHCWFQSSQLKAYLWRWGFKENINAVIYYSFLIPKVKKFIDAMLNEGSQYLEKIELRCQCSISMNFNLGLHMHEYEYFVMEAVFDIHRGKPLGFLDMLKYLMKRIHLTQYFIKNLRTILIKDSSKFVFISQAPLRTLRFLGRNLELGETIEPFFSRADCTKVIYAKHLLQRSQSTDSLFGNEHIGESLKYQSMNWTAEVEIFNYWKGRINDICIDDFKSEMFKLNESFHHWEEIYQKLISSNITKYSSFESPEIMEFNDLVMKCQQQYDNLQAQMESNENNQLKKEINRHKFQLSLKVDKAGDKNDQLYEQIFASKISEENGSPSVTNMRYLMRKQTGLRDPKQNLSKTISSLNSSRGTLLTNQSINHLNRSFSKSRDMKIVRSLNSVSTPKDQVTLNGSTNRKMIDTKDYDFDEISESITNEVYLPLKSKINGKSQKYKESWLKILKLNYQWNNLKNDLKLNDKNSFEWCPIEYYNDFKTNNPIPAQLKSTPLISIFLTLQMLTDKTMVYNTHFRELNDGKSIDIPIILKVNKTPLKPSFFGYLNYEQNVNNGSKLQLLLCQLSYDIFLLSLTRNETLKFIFSIHIGNFDNIIQSQSAAIISEIMEILNLKETLVELDLMIGSTGSMTQGNVEKLVEASNELLFLHEFIFHRKCCSWMEHRYYGIRIIYHSLFIDNNTKCVEPFLRLPGDRRIRKIENRCNSIIVLRETFHTVLNTKRYLIEIFYDFFTGNHFSCVELIGSMLSDSFGSGLRLKAHRTLICNPSGELWVFSDIEWLKAIGNYT